MICQKNGKMWKRNFENWKNILTKWKIEGILKKKILSKREADIYEKGTAPCG
jgi:hypothetical protein